MFNILGAGIGFISDNYVVNQQVVSTDSGGTETISASTFFNISANIQNLKDGEQLELGREDSLGYKSIIILTENIIGIGDPVYDGGIQERFVINYMNKFYRIMMDGPVQVNGYYRYHADLLDYLDNIAQGFILSYSQLNLAPLG